MAESSDWAGHTYLWNMVTRRFTGELTDPDFGVDPLAFSRTARPWPSETGPLDTARTSAR